MPKENKEVLLMKAKTKLTKLWSILLALVMLVGLMHTVALAEETATADFSTDPTTALGLLNAAKTDGAEDSTWDNDTKTLTLNGVNFETTANAAVRLPDVEGGVTIVLNGDNTITGGDSESKHCFGIRAAGSLTIEGDGTLIVTGGDTTREDGGSFGIYASNDLNIEGGTITANGGTALDYGISRGIYTASGNVNISGGTVEATGDEAQDSSFGIYAYSGNVVIEGGTVEATGGDARCGSYGIYAESGNVVIEGGNVEATSGEADESISNGIYTYSGTVNISSGALIATGTVGALYEAPNTLPSSTYWWRTSNVNDYSVYPDSAYTWDSSHKYVEIRDTNPGYTISFDANGGDGTMENQTGISGEYNLPENGFAAPAGMQFKAWEVNGSEKAVGDTITIDETTVIKALWEYINYNIDVTNGTASVDGSQISTAIINEVVTLTAAEIDGKVFDNWVAESGDVTFANANNATTTFTMPAGDVSVKATYATSIPSVAITDIDAPVSNTALDIIAVCETPGVNTTEPTVTWSPSDTKAGYYKDYTASVTLTADAGYKFTEDVTATVNNKSATRVTKNENGTLTVTYIFPKTEKHNIEITFNANVRDGDDATNPSISSGYEVGFCFFCEDTDGDGDFINDRTLVVDKDLLDAFLEEEEMTFEEFQSAIGATIKTKFTGGCTYSVYAAITHSDGAYFDSDEDDKATNAIIKVNNEDITDNCLAYDEAIAIMPGTCVFTASSAATYTVTFDANDGSVTPASAVTGTDGKLTSLPTPTRSRYSFNGWYTEASGGTKVDTDYVFNANTTIYAQWTYTGGGGGGTVATNTVTVGSVKNGDVAISPKYAAKGTIVTLKIEPDKGYKLDTVTVTDKNGNKIKLTDKGNGEYTFTMPVTKVNVETTFVEETTTEDNTMLNFFVDIPYDSYYYDAVLWAAENGITGGMDDTHFAPDITCTRVQAITFLWRAAGSPMPKSSEISFEDVETDSYYYYAVLWALENGITSGTSVTTFSPDDTCSRGQIVTFLWRSVKSPTVGMDNTFTDVSSESYYTDATNWAVANGITSGTSDTTFSPDETCTRGQIVTFLYRFFVK